MKKNKTRKEGEITDSLEKLLDIYPRLQKEDTKEKYRVAMVTLLNELADGVNRNVFDVETLTFYTKYANEIFDGDYNIERKRKAN